MFTTTVIYRVFDAGFPTIITPPPTNLKEDWISFEMTERLLLIRVGALPFQSGSTSED